MKLPDVNVLLHVVDRTAPQHAAAAHWMVQAFAAQGGVGFTWVALLGFLRLSTRPAVFPRCLTVEQALAVQHDWLTQPGARLLHPGPRHAALLGRLLLGAGTAGNLTTDAHIAAVAIEHGATVGTFDRDFRRFAGLEVDLLGDAGRQ